MFSQIGSQIANALDNMRTLAESQSVSNSVNTTQSQLDQLTGIFTGGGFTFPSGFSGTTGVANSALQNSLNKLNSTPNIVKKIAGKSGIDVQHITASTVYNPKNSATKNNNSNSAYFSEAGAIANNNINGSFFSPSTVQHLNNMVSGFGL